MGMVERLGRGTGDLMPESQPIGRTATGETVWRYRLRAGALCADVMTYGATLMALYTPDRSGEAGDIVLGFDTLAPYLAGAPCLGATVGRYANRIADARFEIDGRTYRLAANEGRNHLHGGLRGFDKVVWSAAPLEDGVALRHVSADGGEGYPGELRVEVAYRLSADRLTIEYSARTTKPTHVNLTHHSYFNLSGAPSDIGDHLLQIDADRFAPVDRELIPTGELRGVANTPFDFRSARRIGASIEAGDPQLIAAGGYDHTFVLNKSAPSALTRAAALSEPASGRRMEVWTTEPGLQFYSGNHLDGSLVGTAGPFIRRSGLCLEPQHFPDSPNRPEFPSTLLRPDGIYRSRTEFRFSVEP